jgi:hypothetical protein
MSRDPKSTDDLLIFRLASGPYSTGLDCAQVRQLMLPQIMHLMQIDVVRAQNLQTLLKVAFETVVISSIALTGLEIPCSGYVRAREQSFLRSGRSCCGIPVVDALSESRLKQCVGGTKALFHESCT